LLIEQEIYTEKARLWGRARPSRVPIQHWDQRINPGLAAHGVPSPPGNEAVSPQLLACLRSRYALVADRPESTNIDGKISSLGMGTAALGSAQALRGIDAQDCHGLEGPAMQGVDVSPAAHNQYALPAKGAGRRIRTTLLPTP